MASRENLPDILNEFFKAIDEMNNTVLVPHRLVDIPEENELPSGKCQCPTSTDNSLVKPGKELEDSGLFGTYHMLLDIKEELTTGKPTSAEGCFRSHIKAVMESMKYLTGLARSLTQNYCYEVYRGGEDNFLRPNSFSFDTLEDLRKQNGAGQQAKEASRLGHRGRQRFSSMWGVTVYWQMLHDRSFKWNLKLWRKELPLSLDKT